MTNRMKAFEIRINDATPMIVAADNHVIADFTYGVSAINPNQPLNPEFITDCMKKATTDGEDTGEWDFKLERYHRLKAFLEAEHVI